MSAINQSYIVLHGESVAVKAEPQSNISIKTSSAKESTILCVYKKTEKIAVFAHLGKYTEVFHVLYQLTKFLKKTQMDWSDPSVKIRVFFCKDMYDKQAALIYKIFNALQANFFMVPFDQVKRPQIELHLNDGEFSYYHNNQIDVELESLQKAASKECSNDLKNNPAGLFEMKSIARTKENADAQYVRKSVSENMQISYRNELLNLLRLDEKTIPTLTSQTSPVSSEESKSNHADED